MNADHTPRFAAALATVVLFIFTSPGEAQSIFTEDFDGFTAPAGNFSLADDFSSDENRADGAWSYRLDDPGNSPPAFPLLTVKTRDANKIWGSTFEDPPLMWSGDTGYWGIGKNLTGQKQVSPVNGTTWAPGDVLLHPSPSGLVVAWTAPGDLVVDVRYAFGLASPQSRGIGYSILKRSGGVDTEIVALGNIGSEITNELNGAADPTHGVASGRPFLF
jgi:hypothetical protein